MTLADHVAQRIRELRTTHEGGVSQEALADAIKVATNTISRWETGIYKPALEDLDKLARYFKISILEFFPERVDSEESEGVTALLRAARKLSESDLNELTRYAQFRQAQAILRADRPKPGRKPKER